MFKEIPKETFNKREERILALWQQERIFERSVKQRENAPRYTFYDGPPFATGLPHYGHLLAGTIKDVVPRYQTMKGKRVSRRFGWDCHGLPIENEIEKAFDLSGATSIEDFGIARFNEECRSIVLRYTEEWKTIVTRMGRWVDFNRTWKTMDLTYMESVWWVFKELYNKGLVYEGFKVMPFSAKLGTPLSNFEAGENYKEVDDPAWTIAFPLRDDPNTNLLIWTTTPWTLVSNLAIMAGPDIDYVTVEDPTSKKRYILAEACLPGYHKDPSEYTLIDRFKGTTLEGKRYEPLFDYFVAKEKDGAFQVLLEESVAIDEGTGLVHSAPAFGEIDFYACEKAGIGLVCPVDRNGRFTAPITEYVGQFVKDADKDIGRRIKEKGRMVRQSTCHHRYPFCWRSDTPLIYRAMRTWFVAVEKIKDDLLASNAQTHWTPSHLKEGRFGKWLEGARDWAISRNRYWGTPIPLWRSDEGDILVVGSVAELEELSGQKVDDLHRHHIDELIIEKGGKRYKRIPEVFDCWFESGSMPYAQSHYPFEQEEAFKQRFPADFIAEGLDQTRGWFYTLMVLSTALFKKPAFQNVVVNGILLAEDGSKMSKRLKNYPDPMDVVHKYGADAVRLYMMHSPAVKGDDLRFSERGVELVLRQILIPWWNAFSFFNTYARIYSWKPKPPFKKPQAVVDRWILSLLQKLIHQVEEGMDSYDLSQAVEPFVGFIDQLTNWYIRRSRRRFWEEKPSQDRDEAFATLYQVLMGLTKIAAPFVPFLSDAMYLHLREASSPESVHLCDYPTYHPEMRNQTLEAEMAAVQQVVSLGHALRKEHKLKVRQPLAVAHLASGDSEKLHFLEDQKHLIADELNVKQVECVSDETAFVRLQAKPNFRSLGKKVGKLMPEVQKQIQGFDQQLLENILEGHSHTLQIHDKSIQLTAEDVLVERIVHDGMIASTAQGVTIALDTALSEELIVEGMAREIVNKINTMRREEGFDVSDRIAVTFETSERVETCFEQYRDYISSEVLALEVAFKPCTGRQWDLNGEPAKIHLEKIS